MAKSKTENHSSLFKRKQNSPELKQINLEKRIDALRRYALVLLEFFVIAWIVVTITFLLIHSLPGGDIAKAKSDAEKEVLLHRYGLDKSLVVQYFHFLGRLFVGDFGVSTVLEPGKSINSFLWYRMSISFEIGIISLLLGVSVGIVCGVLFGLKPGGFADNIGAIIISIGIAFPSFVLGLLLMLLGKNIGLPYIFDKGNIVSALLPAIALSISTIIVYMRYLRVEFARELSSQSYKFALARGVSKSRFVIKHALKPALFPVISYLPASIIFAFTGAMFVEQMYGIPGAGNLLLEAIDSKDYNIIQTLVIVYTLMTIISFLLRDVLYKLLDPRVRI